MGSLTSFFLFTLLTITTGKTVDYTGRNLLRVPMDKIRDAYVVKLSDNKITDLGSFNSSPKIRYLYIDNNEVNNISKQTFQGLDELVHLNLNKNYISSLRQFTFSALSALLDLYLNNNFISVVSDRAFYGLTNLEYLDLSGNRLSVFPTQPIKLIPSKQLLWVMIRVNNISQIPTDIKTIHPSTSYDLQGNPLRCSDELATRKNTSGYNLEVSFYTINTIHNRSFVEKTTFLKKFHSYFGVRPHMIHVVENNSITINMPFMRSPMYDYYLDTPTGRLRLDRLGKSIIRWFRARDSGLYTFVAHRGHTKIKYDVLLCVKPPPKEEEQHQTKMPALENLNDNHTNTCPFPTNLTLETNNERGHNVLSVIVPVNLAVMLVTFLPVALFCWRKHRATSRPQAPQAGTATWHTGDPAATVRIPAPVVPGSVAVVSSQNHPFLPRVLLQESQSTTGTVHLPAAHTTQVQIHCQLDDDAAENDHLYEDVDGHLHLYASAAPPPVPDADDGPEHSEDVNGVHEHNDTSARPFPSPLFNPRQQATSASINTNSPQTMSVQPANNMENIVIDGGIATANELYQQHAHFNHESDSGQYQLITTPYFGAEDAGQTETTRSVSRSSLYSQSHNMNHRTYPGQYNLTTTYNCE